VLCDFSNGRRPFPEIPAIPAFAVDRSLLHQHAVAGCSVAASPADRKGSRADPLRRGQLLHDDRFGICNRTLRVGIRLGAPFAPLDDRHRLRCRRLLLRPDCGESSPLGHPAWTRVFGSRFRSLPPFGNDHDYRLNPPRPLGEGDRPS